jgi:cell division protein ZapA
MARIDISLGGRSYPIACDDGQEERVLEIARYLEAKLSEIRASVSTASDMHLLVMAGMLVVDELFDVREELQIWSNAAGAGVDGGAGDGAVAAEVVARLTQRVEALAARLEQA